MNGPSLMALQIEIDMTHDFNIRSMRTNSSVLKVRLHTAIARADFVSWCMLYIHEGNKMHS